MPEPGDIALVIFPGNGEYAFGTIESRVQEGYSVKFSEQDSRRVSLQSIHGLNFSAHLGELSLKEVKQKIQDDPIIQAIVESLIEKIQSLSSDHQATPSY